MSKYKLTYSKDDKFVVAFRYMFHCSGINFQNSCLPYHIWYIYKKIENHQTDTPILKINDKNYNQVETIGRYLAKKCNLYGSNNVEALQIDTVVELIARKIIKEVISDSSIFDHTNVDITTQLCLNMFEEQVKKNGGYFVCGKLSWADVFYTAKIEELCDFAKVDHHMIHEDFPELKRLVDQVHILFVTADVHQATSLFD